MAMNLSRASMKCSRLIAGLRTWPAAAAVAPKPFSTAASEPSLRPSDQAVYGKIVDVSKHTTKTDIINMLDASNLSPEKIRIEYNRSLSPISMMFEFPSVSDFDAAIRSFARKGRLYNMRRADKMEWDANSVAYDGKAIVLLGLPRNAVYDDLERFLSGCHFDSSSVQFNVRHNNDGPIRMALVRFPSQALAMHAYITKNRAFCLNNQITVQVLH